MQNKKWLSFLLALAVSIGLWVYVVTYENQEMPATIYNVPVVFVGEDVLREDYDLLIDKDSLEAGVTLTFYGKLSDIKKLQTNKSEIRVEMDVSSLIRSARDYSLNYDITDVTLPAAVSGSEITLTEQEPRMIDITVINLARKSIEVKVSADLKMSEGYLSDPVSADHKEIIIEGPEDLVNQVDYALVTLSRENVDESISTMLDYTLMSLEGNVLDTDLITSDVQQIQVTVPVVMFKDVSLAVELIPGGGVTAKDVTYEFEPKKIRLSGDKSVLDAIDSIKLENIDLSGMTTNEEVLERTLPIPTGCENLSGVEEVSVTVKIHNKSIKTLRIPRGNFQYIGAPDGYSPEASTALLSVSIRANTRDIDQILIENVRVVADLSEITLQEGAFSVKVPVAIYIDGFDEAGVIGEYSIVVDLAPVEDTAEEESNE